MTVEKLYYIQNTHHVVGNCALFWRKDGCGYTCNLDEAWKVTKLEAEEVCRSRPKEDFPRDCEKVDRVAQRHFDVQKIKSIRW